MAKQRKGTGSPRENPPRERRAAPGRAAAPKAPPKGDGEPDFAVVARNVGLGFTILIFAALTQLVVIRLFEPLALVWFLLGAVITFAVVGVRTGARTTTPVRFGALAAVLSYALIVPVTLMLGSFVPVTTALYLVGGLVIGALAGRIGARSAAS